ncbi:hypothetical protein K431DRAFT_342366 [Polychaeton citri CBS 116435]|uniref:Prion-inhibition and propagation HeLo domain-containing protein n=1 Tax=Polychaeton citri CBS 116435 TaxID=1314669 RepID=A0A9P4QF43_9PEZI|nr:hypothetical protein K431DRAFT_342366 [Polychaeton citri CBS 116435]
MAEPFGIVSGAVGIATAFSACVECFNYVQIGRHFGKDFQTELLTLSMLRLRLTRWGEAVHVYDDPQLGNPTATPTEVSTAKDAIFQMLVLFADSEKVSKKYRLPASGSTDLSVYTDQDLAKGLATLDNQMRNLAAQRQKRASLFKLASWAIYKKEHFVELTDNITKLLDHLEALFPASSDRSALASREVDVLTEDSNAAQTTETLEVLKALSAKVDADLERETEKRAAGAISIGQMEGGDRLMLNQGDTVLSGWKDTGGKLPSGGDIKINSLRFKDDGKINVGSTYGGEKHSFWG